MGALLLGISFELLTLLPITNFSYTLFTAILVLMGTGSGLFAAPNIVSILSSVPSPERSAASGIRGTLQNIAMLLSNAMFLTLILTGASGSLTQSIYSALVNAGVPSIDVERLVAIPSAVALFAAFLGYDPIKTMITQAGITLPNTILKVIDDPRFFPSAIAPAMAIGFYYAYHIAAILAFIAAVFSLLRGKERFQ